MLRLNRVGQSFECVHVRLAPFESFASWGYSQFALLAFLERYKPVPVRFAALALTEHHKTALVHPAALAFDNSASLGLALATLKTDRIDIGRGLGIDC